MPLYTFAGLAVGIAFVSVGLYHVAFVGPHFRAIGRTLRGDNDDVDGESLARLRISHDTFERSAAGRLDALENLTSKELLKVGFLRFNSFADVGSDLSYAIALLNEHGDGVVLTSIYSREETRTYGKAVRGFVPAQGASKEEEAAISMSRRSAGVGVA